MALTRRIQQALSAAALAAALLGGCDKVKVSDENIQLMKDTEVVAALNDDKTIIVDVRKPERYAAGHIPSAVNIYVPQIVALDARLANAKRIVVYAGGWTDGLSQAATKKMLALGYTGVYEFKGGMENWKDAGQQVVTSAPPAAARPETGKDK
jgi:phage shock protein E